MTDSVTQSRGVLAAVSSETTSEFSKSPRALDTPPPTYVNSPYSKNLNFEYEYSSEYSASLSDYNMKIVETDKNCHIEEHLPVFPKKNLMVNSSEASISQDVSKVINSDISNTICDEYLNESLRDKSSMSYTSIDYSIMNAINDSKEIDFLDEKCDVVLSTGLTSSEASIKPEVPAEYINENSKYKSKHNNKKKQCAEDSSQTSDSLSASECEYENYSGNVIKEKLSLKLKKSFTSSTGVLESVSSETTSEFPKSPQDPDIPHHISVNSPHSTNLYFKNKYASQYSVFPSKYNMEIVEADENCQVEEYLPVSAQKDLMVNSSEESVSQYAEDSSKTSDTLSSSEWDDRKISSNVEIKNLSLKLKNLFISSKTVLDAVNTETTNVFFKIPKMRDTPPHISVNSPYSTNMNFENAYSSEYSASLYEYNKKIIQTDKKSHIEEHLPAFAENNLMVNSSKASVFQDVRNVINSNVSNTMCDESFNEIFNDQSSMLQTNLDDCISSSFKDLEEPDILEEKRDSVSSTALPTSEPPIKIREFVVYIDECRICKAKKRELEVAEEKKRKKRELEVAEEKKRQEEKKCQEEKEKFRLKIMGVLESVGLRAASKYSRKSKNPDIPHHISVNSPHSTNLHLKNKCKSKDNNKRKKYAEDSSQPSDTLSVSECKDEKNSSNGEIGKLSFKRKKMFASSTGVLEAVDLQTTSEFSKSSKNPDIPHHISANSPHSTNLYLKNKCKSKDNNKRKKYAEDSSQTSDNLSASECKDKKDSSNGEIENLSLKQKKMFISTKGALDAVSTETTSVFSKSPQNLDNPCHISINSSDSTNLNFVKKYSSDCSASLSEYNMEIVDIDKKCHDEEHSPMFADKNLRVNIFEASVSQDVSNVLNSDVSTRMCDESLKVSLRSKSSMLNTSLDQGDEYEDLKNDDGKKSGNVLENGMLLRIAEDSSQTSDNITTSESKDENESGNVLKENSSLKRKALFTTSIDVSEAVMSEATSEFLKSPENLNSVSTNLNFENKYSSDYSVSLSEYNMEVADTDKKCHVEEHLPVLTQENLMVNPSEASVCQGVSNVISSNVCNRMCGEYLNESLNDKTMLNTSLVEKDESEGLKKDDGKKSDILPENGTLLKIVKVGETYDENMGIKRTDVIMPESFIESSSEMSKYNHKNLAPECEIALSYANGKPETNILTPDVNNVHDMNLRESIQITKTIDSKTISKIDINNASKENCNNISSSSVIICENYLDSIEEVSKQEKEITKVKMDISENISQVNNISLLKNVSSPETVNEKNENTPEDHKTNIEELGLISNPEKVKEIENLDSEKNQNNTKADLCMKSDYKYENVQLPYSEISHLHKNVISPEKIRLHDNDESGTAEQKKWPELKISLIKNNRDSPDDLKNWFLSETKQFHEVIHSASDIKVPKTPVDSVSSIIDMHQENALNAKYNSAQYLERNFDAVTSDPSVPVDRLVCDANISLINDKSLTNHKLTLVKTTTIIKDHSQLTDTSKTLTRVMPSDSSLSDHSSHNNDIFYKDLAEKTASAFFDDNPLINLSDSYYKDLPTKKADSLYFKSHFFDINDISDKDMSVKKDNILFPEDNPLAFIDKMLDEYISSKNTCTSLSDDSSLQDKTPTKDTNAEKALDTFSPVSIKEEQLDEEEDIGRNSISIKGILEADNTHKRPIATPHTPPDQNLFHNANNILDKDICDEKGNILFPENNVFDEIDKLVPVSTSLFDDNSLLDKTTTKYTNAKIVLDTVSPVSNKDPLDEKKNIGMNSSLNNLSSQVKSENSQAASEAKKKKQGRLHTASASKISPSNVMLSSALKEACTHETQKYKGQKKKTVLSASSTSSIRTKNYYDAELVCVPFSMGWRRLHVIRATGRDDNNKRLSYIYYFAPDGTKFRSKAEIGTYLSKYPDIKLTLNNFTFAKKLIYRKPFETVRYSRRKYSSRKVTKAVKKVVSKKKRFFSEDQGFDALNEKLFGKYPVVKCEKLEIENFVKNNKIKVSNWPLHHTETPKNNKTADFKKDSN